MVLTFLHRAARLSHTSASVTSRLGRPTAVSLLLATLLSAFVPAGQAAEQAPANPTAPTAADPAKPTVRPNVAKVLAPAQDQIKAQKYAEAVETLKGADAITDLTPTETLLVHRLRGVALVASGNLEQGDAAQLQVVNDPLLLPEDRQAVDKMMTQTWYGKTPQDHVLFWAKRYFEDGGKDDVVHTIVTQTLYKSGDCQATLAALEPAIASVRATGRHPAEGRLQMRAACQQKLKDESGLGTTLEELATVYKRKEYWNSLLSLVERRSTFDEHAVLDGYRFRVVAGNINDPEEFIDMAQLALKAGYPEEARRALDLGVSSGVLAGDKAGPDYPKLRAQADSQAEEDRKLLGQGDAKAEAAKTGVSLFSTGLNYVTHQKYDVGIPMMERGLAKGGVKYPELALLELGSAHAVAGHKEEALKAFTQVKGTEGSADLAHLWMLYLNSQP